MKASEIIARLGGTAKTAELCEVTDSAVSQWINAGIPKPRLMFLKLARPDIFCNPSTLPYAIPNGAKKRESKGGSRQPIDPKKDMT